MPNLTSLEYKIGNKLLLLVCFVFWCFQLVICFLASLGRAIKELVSHPHQDFDIHLPPFSENVCLKLALMEGGLHDIEQISVPLSNLISVSYLHFVLDHKMFLLLSR